MRQRAATPPRFDGVVVCEEHAEMLQEAAGTLAEARADDYLLQLYAGPAPRVPLLRATVRGLLENFLETSTSFRKFIARLQWGNA